VILKIIKGDKNENTRVNSELGQAKQKKNRIYFYFISYELTLSPNNNFNNQRARYPWSGLMLPSGWRTFCRISKVQDFESGQWIVEFFNSFFCYTIQYNFTLTLLWIILVI